MAERNGAPRFSFMGDSISTFEGCNPAGFDVFYEGERCARTGVENRCDTWWHQVVEHFGGTMAVNGSFSGSMVEGAGFPAASSVQRVEALGSSSALPDAIVVFMGINDYGWGGPDAQAHGAGRATPSCSRVGETERRVAALAPLDAADRFGEAYDLMLGRIKSAYSATDVWCCTLCPGRVTGEAHSTFIRRLRGVSFDSYNEAIRAAASRNGCRLIDFAAYGLDYEAADGTHPTARGMRQLSAMAICSMEKQGAFGGVFTQRARDRFEEAFSSCDMASESACDKRSCIDCPFARGTGNAWSLVCEKPLRPRS